MATLQSQFESQKTRRTIDRRWGLAAPFSATAAGGLAVSQGEENDFKAISMALMGHDNDNAFQQPTDDIEQALFGIDGPAGYALVLRRIESAFADFAQQHRYRLVEGSVLITSNSNGTFVKFQYHNLESDEIKNLAVPIEG